MVVDYAIGITSRVFALFQYFRGLYVLTFFQGGGQTFSD